MRIGLLTFHFPINYGALLQTYALDSYLKKLGFDVEIINYYSDEHKAKYNFYQKPTSIKDVIFYLIKTIFILNHLKKSYKFKRFRKKHFELTQRYKKSEEVPFDYDIVITGSDQVFNINYSDRYIYFQPFEKLLNQKKIAYAPSFGIHSFDDTFKNKIENLVKDFDFLSCRELEGTTFLKKITGKEVPHVLDPVFLLDNDEWSKIASKRIIKDDYIFVYDLNGKKTLIHIAKSINKNKKIVLLSNDPIAKIKKEYKGVDIFIQSVGIEDFISLIKYSSAVVTDSFHGIAMSIIFNKDFYCYIALEIASSRILSLLKTLSLESRIINSINPDSIPASDLNTGLTSTKLVDWIEKSKMYLNNSLS